MSTRAMDTAITAMKANQTKLDVISNNIANSSTTAFKTSTVNFADTLYQASAGASAPTANTGGTNAKEVGLGANISSIDKLMSQGNAEATGRTLDNMIDGDGYFIVTKGAVDESIPVTTNALGNGTGVFDTQFTRDGNFHLDEKGNLVTSNGYRVMGYYSGGTSGTDTPITGDATTGIISVDETKLADPDTTKFNSGSLNPLVIPTTVKTSSGTEAVTAFSIGSDGVVTITTASKKTYAIGQVGMASFTNPEGLEDTGNNFVTQSTNSGTALIRSCKTLPSGETDNSGSFGSVKSGYLEASNVDLTTEFANMITTSKSFQAASKMITNEGDILDTVIGLVR